MAFYPVTIFPLGSIFANLGGLVLLGFLDSDERSVEESTFILFLCLSGEAC